LLGCEGAVVTEPATAFGDLQDAFGGEGGRGMEIVRMVMDVLQVIIGALATLASLVLAMQNLSR